jgi:hypothetical protein
MGKNTSYFMQIAAIFMALFSGERKLFAGSSQATQKH